MFSGIRHMDRIVRMSIDPVSVSPTAILPSDA